MIHLTFDQDWAPEWATMEVVAALAQARLRGTFFVTQTCPSLARLRAVGAELAWHPNFLPGSSHGDAIDAVLDTLAGWVPDARGARAHCLVRGTPYLAAYQGRGLIYDAADLHDGVADLAPFLSWTGVVRIPIFFEDDVHLARGHACELTSLGLERSGLKVFSFHPVLLALNACDLAAYQALKSSLSQRDIALTDATREDFAPFVNKDTPGVADLLQALLTYLARHPDVAGGTLAQVAERTLADAD